MEQRQNYLSLLDLINHVLREEEVPADMNWEQVFLLASRHHLTGFVYRAASGREGIPPEIVEQVETGYFSAAGEQSRQEHYADLLFTALREREIRYLPMAGFILRKLYPQPTWRNSSDLDIAVSQDHRDEVGQYLSDLSFTRAESNQDFDFYTLDHVGIRVHGIAQETFWDDMSSEDGIEYHYSDEEFYMELLTIMKRLLIAGKCGVRPVLDLYIYRHAKPDMDRARIEQYLEEEGLVTLEKSMVKLSEVWFGDEEMDDDMMLLGSYIAAAGALAAKKEVERHRVWRAVFPRYRTMKRRYPFLNRVRILLPIMWVWRWFALLFSRGHDRQEEELKQNADNRSAKMEERVMQIAGITV